MSDLQDLLARLPIDQIAGMLGTDPDTARSAAEAVLPSLVAGLQNNAQDPNAAASIEQALAGHQNDLASGTVDAGQVDTADGEKIVQHVFGAQTDDVANHLAGAANLSGAGGDIVRKILPILAPIVMSWIASKVFGGQAAGQAGAGQAGAGQAQPGSGNVIGDVLGSILGGAQQGTQGQGGGVLGNILGSVLGGGSGGGTQASGGPLGGLGSILGGVLGGQRQTPTQQ